MSKSNRFIPLLWACATLALMAGAVSTSLSANTITMDAYNGASNEVSCDAECYGFVGPYPGGPISLDFTMADNYPSAGNPTGELYALNALLAIFNPPRAQVSYVNKTDGDGDGFSTNREYFSIKKAGMLWFFANTSGGSVAVDLVGNTADYSHWTEYGAVVPVPAAVWLFGTALIGLLGFSKRRKNT